MTNENIPAPERDGNRRRGALLLATYLLHVPGLDWPGADSLTIEEVASEYPRLAANGRVPPVEELARRYPDLASSIAAFLA